MKKELQPGKEVIQSLLNLRDELILKYDLLGTPEPMTQSSMLAQEVVWKINSCLFRKYPL